MTAKQFYDWQTVGGTDEVVRYVDGLGDKLVWLCAQNGDEIILKVVSAEERLRQLTNSARDRTPPQSRRLKQFVDITRLVESHPELWEKLTDDLKSQIDQPQ